MLTHLPCFLSKGPLKHGFLEIYLSIFFGAGISRNTLAKGACSFGKCLKFNKDFKSARKNGEKKVFFGIIASELVAVNCLY